MAIRRAMAMMTMPYFRRMLGVANLKVSESIALLMTSGTRSWRKSTNRRQKIPTASLRRFRTKYSFKGKKFLSIFILGDWERLMEKEILEQGNMCQSN